MFASLLPFKGNKPLTEKSLFLLPGEDDEHVTDVDLEEEIRKVEADKEYWKKIDKNVSSTS